MAVENVEISGGPCTRAAGLPVWDVNTENSADSYSGNNIGWTYTNDDASTCVDTLYPATWTITGPVGGELHMTESIPSIGGSLTLTRAVS